MIRLSLLAVTFLAAMFLATTFVTVTGPAFAQAPGAEAARIHRDALVFDAHLHFVNRQLYLGGDIGERLPGPMSGIGIDLPNAKDGGIDAMFLNLYVEPEYVEHGYEVKQTVKLIELAREQIHNNRDTIEMALNADDVERIARSGKIAAVLDLEGAFDKEGDLGVLRGLYNLGLRSLQIAGNSKNHEFADSSCCTARWGGINDHGRAVIREMNRLGIVINLAHASEATWMQVVEASDDPVVATHQGMRALNPDHPANAGDEMVKALAAKGGVLAVHFSPNTWSPLFFREFPKSSRGLPPSAPLPALSAHPRIAEIANRHRVSYARPYRMPPAEIIEPVTRFVDAIDYAVELIGEDNVALGSDFGGGINSRGGMTNVREYPSLTRALVEKGYSEERIRKILGGNWLRVFREITQ